MHAETEDRRPSWPLDYRPEPESYKPRKHPAITPEMHEKIKRLYRNKRAKSGDLTAFCRRHGVPNWKVSRYAQRQGWMAKTKKEPRWSDRELAILERYAHLCPERIQLKLKTAGFKRSLSGIIVKLKRGRFLQNLNGQTARSVALCLGEDEHFVTKAIKDGMLKADRRGTKRTEAQGGDMWFIKDKDLRQFVIDNVHMIDLRKVDKWWFVDLLTGKGDPSAA